MYRTLYARSLDLLVARLSGYAIDDDLQGADWAQAIVEAFLASPAIWPLDDELFEMLLAFAGVDLNTPGGTAMAVGLSRYLEGTGICPIACAHPAVDPSPRCVRVRAGENDEAYQAGLDLLGTHPRSHWLDQRTLMATVQSMAVEIENRLGGDVAERDDQEDYPDAA